MSVRQSPPFRADHVGSFLRPLFLLEARDRAARGEIGRAELVRSRTRRSARWFRFQESVGLKSVPDGEFRRTYFTSTSSKSSAAYRQTSRSVSRSPMGPKNSRRQSCA